MSIVLRIIREFVWVNFYETPGFDIDMIILSMNTWVHFASYLQYFCIEKKCLSREILSGECKQILTPMMMELLEKHQAAREEVKDRVDEFSAARLRDEIRR